MDKSEIIDQIKNLNNKQKKALIDYIKSSYSIFDEKLEVNACPHCGSGKIIKNGNQNGCSRFLCKVCNKTFNSLRYVFCHF